MIKDSVSVKVVKTFRRKIEKKAERYGEKKRICDKTGVDRDSVRRLIDSGRVRKSTLVKLVKHFEGEDADVYNYIID